MLYSLQALRAFAAWVVVCHHFMQIFFDFHATGPIGQLLTDRGAIGVDIFFVISGLVIYLSTRDKSIEPRQFLLNRVMRIVPAYWFYTALMAMLLLAFSQWMPHQEFAWHHLFLSLLFIPAENPGGYGLYPTLNVGWTLNFEMFFYLLFGLAFLVRQRHHLLLVSAALLLVSEVLGRVGVLSHFYNNDIIYEFLLGIGLGVLHRRGLIRQGRWLPLVVLGGGRPGHLSPGCVTAVAALGPAKRDDRAGFHCLGARVPGQPVAQGAGRLFVLGVPGPCTGAVRRLVRQPAPAFEPVPGVRPVRAVHWTNVVVQLPVAGARPVPAHASLAGGATGAGA